ncbi:MAG: signal peptidase II [Chloroflexota bacterium]
MEELKQSNPDKLPEQTPLPKATFREMTILVSVAGLALVLDQWTKNIVEANMPLNSISVPFPAIEEIFRFTHVANTGAAFGMFQNGGTVFMIFAVIVSIGILYYNFFGLEGNQRLMRVALGLQLGGALGNFIDRVRIGHVTDFIDIGPWYIFNVADMSIVGGAIVLGFIVFQEMREERAQAQLAEKATSQSQQQQPTQ